MNTLITIGIITSVILAVCSYITTNNFIVPIVCLVLSLLYFILIARPIIQKYQTKTTRFHQCYHFINSFIVSLSIRKSIVGAYEAAMQSMPEDFVAKAENTETFDYKERLDNLSKYFRFHVFSLFLDLINLYEEQGGDILSMSHYLLEETRYVEEYISTNSLMARRKLFEFGFLWLLSLSIMILVRFSLASFYHLVAKQIFFPIGICGICVFVIASIHIAILRMTKLDIKGWNDHEKI